MIVRMIVVDPRPNKPEDDLVVYQVPENSRAHKLLEEVFDAQGIEHTLLGVAPKRRKQDAGG